VGQYFPEPGRNSDFQRDLNRLKRIITVHDTVVPPDRCSLVPMTKQLEQDEQRVLTRKRASKPDTLKIESQIAAVFCAV
jgi:hypothetical protein